MPNHGSSARDDHPAEWQVAQRIERCAHAWRDAHTLKESCEHPVRVTHKFCSEARKCWVTRNLLFSDAVDENGPLIVIEEGCSTAINKEAASKYAECGKDGSTTLFADLDAGQEAPPTKCLRRFSERTIL
jgi:hypothetical protein